MIKLIDYKTSISRTVDEACRYISTFVADEVSDITAMNAQGSEYLNYPAGSAALCLEDGNVYILNAAETEYEVPGGTSV